VPITTGSLSKVKSMINDDIHRLRQAQADLCKLTTQLQQYRIGLANIQERGDFDSKFIINLVLSSLFICTHHVYPLYQ
jgi:DNA invertase Pin-like site-specific DNA recombinase